MNRDNFSPTTLKDLCYCMYKNFLIWMYLSRLEPQSSARSVSLYTMRFCLF